MASLSGSLHKPSPELPNPGADYFSPGESLPGQTNQTYLRPQGLIEWIMPGRVCILDGLACLKLDIPIGHSLAGSKSKREFESLVVTHLDFFMGLATQLTRNRDLAEDLVQESVLKAFRSFSSFRAGSNFRAWVARIITNTFLNERERDSRWDHSVDIDDLHDSTLEAKPTQIPEQSAKRLEEIPGDALSDEVLTALHQLPGAMALAVYLADAEEMTYEEIAEILNVPVGTVRSRISRGRQHLQKKLLRFAQEAGVKGRRSS